MFLYSLKLNLCVVGTSFPLFLLFVLQTLCMLQRAQISCFVVIISFHFLTKAVWN